MQKMSSLSNALARSQQSIPVKVLDACLPDDRQIVENIAVVAQAQIPIINIGLCTLNRDTTTSKYILTVPCCGTTPVVKLNELRAIQTYNPARVNDIRAFVSEGTFYLRIDICDETMPLTCSELEVVRMTKRSRWF